MYTFFRTLSYVFVDLLYEREEKLKPFPMMFMRSIIGIAFMLILVNVDLKKDTWDSVTRDHAGSLTFKTFAGTIKDIINFSTSKYIPLTIISVFSNLAPIAVVALAYLILKEVVKKFDIAMILLTLAGIFLCIFGADNSDE